MPNTPEVAQGATLLNAVVKQATGQSAIGNLTNLSTFVSTATTLLALGKDPVLNALTQVMETTVFAERPYDQPLASLAIPGDRWGNIIRKLSPVADEMEARGIVSAKDGSKPRKCLITREEWLAMQAATESA